HRAHPQAGRIVGMLATDPLLEFLELRRDIPGVLPGDRGGLERLISLPERPVALRAELVDLLAPRHRGCARSVSTSDARDERQGSNRGESGASRGGGTKRKHSCARASTNGATSFCARNGSKAAARAAQVVECTTFRVVV